MSAAWTGWIFYHLSILAATSFSSSLYSRAAYMRSFEKKTMLLVDDEAPVLVSARAACAICLVATVTVVGIGIEIL